MGSKSSKIDVAEYDPLDCELGKKIDVTSKYTCFDDYTEKKPKPPKPPKPKPKTWYNSINYCVENKNHEHTRKKLFVCSYCMKVKIQTRYYMYGSLFYCHNCMIELEKLQKY